MIADKSMFSVNPQVFGKGGSVQLSDTDKFELVAPDMSLTSIVACTTKRPKASGVSSKALNNYVTGIQLTYGSFDENG